MSQPTIIFFSCEPGGAEILTPVVKLLAEVNNYKTEVFSYGYANERFFKNGVPFTEISKIDKNDFSLFLKYRPELIITSATSLPSRDMSEKYLWHNASLYGIESIAFLDQWQNYAIRFSGVSRAERLFYLPSFINCINEIGEKEMIEAGVDSSRLIKFGHPSLDTLSSSHLSAPVGLKESLGIGHGENVILFASEAILEHYDRVRGYDQYDCLRLFFQMNEDRPNCLLLIKLHPKDRRDRYIEIAKQYPNAKVLFVQNELSAIDCILISEEVYGMTSIMLIESYILGRKTISLQPGLTGEDNCVLSRYNIIPLIRSDVELHAAMAEGPGGHCFDFKFKKELFLKFVSDLLERKRAP